MALWVDFAELKQRVTIVDLLQHYGLLEGLKPQKGGEELVGLCPFHEETRGSFHVWTTKNGYHCFGCQARGNIISFVAQMESVVTREAALLIAGWFNIQFENRRRHHRAGDTRTAAATDITVTGEEVAIDNEEVAVPGAGKTTGTNAQLSFELKGLDPTHSYLQERGLTPQTIEHFGLGYCSKGLMRGRIAIPLHDEASQLIGYLGRWPGDPPDGQERYKLPKGFIKSAILYNLNRAREVARDNGKGELIITEGAFTIFRLWQLGIENAVALLGSHLSVQQQELLGETMEPTGKITLLLDNDEAGATGAAQCALALVDQLYVKQVKLPEGIAEPDELSDEQLRELLG